MDLSETLLCSISLESAAFIMKEKEKSKFDSFHLCYCTVC